MRAIITVVGRDTVGIIAEVTSKLSDKKVNILDISQSVLQELFAMVMLVDISQSTTPFPQLADELEAVGEQKGVRLNVMHEDVFSAMHRI